MNTAIAFKISYDHLFAVEAFKFDSSEQKVDVIMSGETEWTTINKENLKRIFHTREGNIKEGKSLDDLYTPSMEITISNKISFHIDGSFDPEQMILYVDNEPTPCRYFSIVAARLFPNTSDNRMQAEIHLSLY